ncbi:MAG: conserved membrane protein of unknown function [Candidatus Thorarchaeota archaeon]|nr:MAG: conserved membrane protein of unknown function [Candidatus Thorarchaeota archaeon]
MSQVQRSTRTLLAGLYVAGLIYIVFVIANSRFDIGILIAVTITLGLLYSSLLNEPITKRGLVIVLLLIMVYIVTTLVLQVFSEVVIMACGGLLLYGILMSVPKFPLTKRAIGTGLIVGIIMTFLGIYLALKIGIVYFVGAELLGFLILSIYGQYTPEENTIVVTIANGSSMISLGVLITFPAIAIFQPEIASDLITYPFIAFVTGISAIFGLVLLLPFRDRFEKDPWPQVIPQAQCIRSLGSDINARKSIIAGLAGSAGWTGSIKFIETITGNSISTIPNALTPVIPSCSIVPNWIGLSNSPLIAGIGYFVGWKRTVIMAIGSVITILIWVFLEGADGGVLYDEHLRRPEILYIALGVFAAVIAGDVLSARKEKIEPEEFEKLSDQLYIGGSADGHHFIIEQPHKAKRVAELARVQENLFSFDLFRAEVKEMISDPREYLRSRRGQLPPWVALASLAIFIVIGIIIFSIIAPFPNLQIHWLLFVLGTPVVIISAYFTARAISETGMLAGYISDMMAIPAILFFRVTFQAITTFMSMLGALQDAAIAVLVHWKLGRLTGVRGRDILKAVFIGTILGTIVGSWITYFIFESYGFGGSDFPSPAAQLFGFLVTSLTGLVNFQLPGLDQFPNVHPLFSFGYLFSFGVGGFLTGRYLNNRGLSSISLAVGLLVPPATTATMLLGGYIHYRSERKRAKEDDVTQCDIHQERTNRVMSGIVAGEAIVTVIWVLWNAIRIFT